jgi:hypothetical protein
MHQNCLPIPFVKEQESWQDVQLPQIHIPLILEFFVLSLWARGRGVLVACTAAVVMGSNMHFTFGLANKF